MFRWMALAALLLLAALLTLPVLSLAASWLQFDAVARDVLLQMAQTALDRRRRAQAHRFHHLADRGAMAVAADVVAKPVV